MLVMKMKLPYKILYKVVKNIVSIRSLKSLIVKEYAEVVSDIRQSM